MPAVGPAASEQGGWAPCCVPRRSYLVPTACLAAWLAGWAARPCCHQRAQWKRIASHGSLTLPHRDVACNPFPPTPPPSHTPVDLPRGAIIHTNRGDIWLKLFPDEASHEAPPQPRLAAPPASPSSASAPACTPWAAAARAVCPRCTLHRPALWRPLYRFAHSPPRPAPTPKPQPPLPPHPIPLSPQPPLSHCLPASPPPRLPVQCPKTVENFTTHAKNGYYDGIIFHRVIKGFMLQTGDPLGELAPGWGPLARDVGPLARDRLFNPHPTPHPTPVLPYPHPCARPGKGRCPPPLTPHGLLLSASRATCQTWWRNPPPLHPFFSPTWCSRTPC